MWYVWPALKEHTALYEKPTSELRDITYHIGSHMLHATQRKWMHPALLSIIGREVSRVEMYWYKPADLFHDHKNNINKIISVFTALVAKNSQTFPT